MSTVHWHLTAAVNSGIFHNVHKNTQVEGRGNKSATFSKWRMCLLGHTIFIFDGALIGFRRTCVFSLRGFVMCAHRNRKSILSLGHVCTRKPEEHAIVDLELQEVAGSQPCLLFDMLEVLALLTARRFL